MSAAEHSDNPSERLAQAALDYASSLDSPFDLVRAIEALRELKRAAISFTESGEERP